MNEDKDFQQRSSESVLLKPFRRLAYALRPEKVFVTEEQYCHIFDRGSGETETVEGSTVRRLGYDERVVGGVEEKVVVPERAYCIVENPWDGQTVQFGGREVRKGPDSFALHPGEELEQDVTLEHVLTKYDSLLVVALGEVEEHKAGDRFLVKGPKTYVPTKDERVVKERRAISLSDTDGVYVQNLDTGEVSPVQGPQDYFLEANEALFEKPVTGDELKALGLQAQVSPEGARVLTRQAANRSFLEDTTKALVLELEDNEVVFLYDGSDTRIVQGPGTEFVGAYERPKVLTLSGGRPIQQGALKVALLKLGPDFIYDQVAVRTKDNAKVHVDVTYKWRFPGRDEESLRKIFSIDDFVGYAAETLSSSIRTVAAAHDFEEFHAKSLEYITAAVFGDEGNRVFEENGLEIFGIDVTGITPEDPDVAVQLNTAIKKNMEIYCEKLVLKATLESERQEVEGKLKIEEERTTLIEAQLKNSEAKVVGGAQVTAKALAVTAQSEADATSVREGAKVEAERARLDSIVEGLAADSEGNYLALEKAQTFAGAEKLVIVPSDANFVLPYLGE